MWRIWEWSRSLSLVTGPVFVWQTEKRLEKDSLIMGSERGKKKWNNLQMSGDVRNNRNATSCSRLPAHIMSPMEKVLKVRDRKSHNSINMLFCGISASVLIALDVWCYTQLQCSALYGCNTPRGKASYDTSADDTNLLQSHAESRSLWTETSGHSKQL